MAGPLLETKLHIPRWRRSLVARPRLSERLSRGAESALTLVSAPAGFGKTTLLAEWLAVAAAGGRSVAWLSLDHRDKDPALFWTDVAAALTSAAPGGRAGAVAPCLNEVRGLALTAADVAALEGRTEGWIAALQLAALSMQGRADVTAFIDGFAGDDRYIVDFLAEEVLQRQPEHVQHFLLQTAILDRLNGPLCDAVTGQDGGKARLTALERGNLFLVPLDDRRHWYRYHQLFADVLHARLRAE